MKEASMAEQWRNKMTYKTTEHCGECGNPLIAWRQEERGKPFCEYCIAEKMKEEEEEQRKEWTKEAYRAKALHRLKGSSLVKDKDIWNFELNQYKAVDNETEQALIIARQAVLTINEGKTIHVVYSGVAGAGKTALSIGILKELLSLDVNKHCMFLNYQYFLEERKASFSDKSLKMTIDKIAKDATKADVLVIDDIGAESTTSENKRQKASDFTVTELNSLLEGRLNKPTIITTNLNGRQIREAYGERITSRIFAHSKGYAMAFNETKDKRIFPVKES